jgi:hypothetical protein
LTTVLALIAVAVVGVAVLARLSFIVVDGHVLWWQVAPIANRGVVRNGREYRAVLYYVEQIFERGGFDKPNERKLVDKLNAMLSDYHTKTQRSGADAA